MMKKKYEKPGFYIENFALSQSIAHNCHIQEEDCIFGKPTSQDIYQCGWDDGTGEVTWSAPEFCNQLQEGDSIDNVGCYNNPEGPINLFEFS